jgi:hypothetical protein
MRVQVVAATLALSLGANLVQPAYANQLAIQNTYKEWKASQLRARNYLADSQCNLQGVIEQMKSGRSVNQGFGTAGFSYGDINRDGTEDALVTFNPWQCDGGNALMNAQTAVLILSASDGPRYFVDDTRLENIKGLPNGMWAVFERVTSSGKITGTAYGYSDADARCCPSLKAGFTYTYPSSKLNIK